MGFEARCGETYNGVPEYVMNIFYMSFYYVAKIQILAGGCHLFLRMNLYNIGSHHCCVIVVKSC